MGQTITFLFLLLAADLDSVSGKLPELRPTGVSFDFKATLSLHSMLPSHAAFPFLPLDSPPPKTLTSSLAMVHVRQ